jgi:hypothetical protein
MLSDDRDPVPAWQVDAWNRIEADKARRQRRRDFCHWLGFVTAELLLAGAIFYWLWMVP